MINDDTYMESTKRFLSVLFFSFFIGHSLNKPKIVRDLINNESLKQTMDWSNIVFLIEKQALHVTLERILIESLKKHKPKLGLNGGMAFPAHG